MIKNYWQTLGLFSRDARLYLAANTLTMIAYVGIYVMLFNLYLLRLGYGPEFIGLINAAAQFGVVLISLPAGILGRRYGSRRMLIVGLTVATVGLGLVPLAEFVPASWQTSWLVVMYVVAWLGGAIEIVNGLPFVMSVTDSTERTYVFSMREALAPLAVFAGSLLGGLLPGVLAVYGGDTLADPAPYRTALFIAAALFGVAPLAMWATSSTEANERPQPQTASPAAKIPPVKSAAPLGLIAFMALVMLLQLAGKSVTDTFFNVYLDVNLHLSPAWMGSLSAVAQLLVVPIALVAPLMLTRWGKRRTIIGGTLGMALSLLLLVLLPHWSGAGLGFMGISALFAITTLAFNICSQELVPPEWRAAMSGALTTATGLSRAGLAFGGGYVITTFGFSTLFLVGVGLTVAGAVLFWGYTWLPRRYILYRAALRVSPSPAGGNPTPNPTVGRGF